MLLGLLDPDPLVRGTYPDPEPDPDPSIYNQAKIVRKTLIPTVSWLQKVISENNWIKKKYF
jgi:hypothetical protein